MMQMLFRHPEKGFLGGHTLFYRRGVTVIQYWRSFEDVEKFARSSSEPHLDVWKKFNQTIGSNGGVGIWHETYLIEPNRFESVYQNMPVYGLALATKHVPGTGYQETARRRLGGDNERSVCEVIAMVATGVNMTLEDYLNYDDGRDTHCELVDGVLVEMPRESTLNTQIIAFLLAAFLQFGIPYTRLGIRHQVAVTVLQLINSSSQSAAKFER